MSTNQEKQKSIVRALVYDVGVVEREALRRWAEGLLQIRAKNLPASKKVKEAIKLTKESKVIAPVIKKFAIDLKRVGWDNRSWKSRLGMGTSMAILVAAGSAGAGIAAMGTAISVPLWVVIGAGGAFAGAIVDEVKSKSNKPKTAYTDIEAEKEIEKKR